MCTEKRFFKSTVMIEILKLKKCTHVKGKKVRKIWGVLISFLPHIKLCTYVFPQYCVILPTTIVNILLFFNIHFLCSPPSKPVQTLLHKEQIKQLST